MGQRRVTWGDIERYCRRHEGFEIRTKGGDKIIVGPAAKSAGGRPVVRIGHTSTRNSKTEVLRCYVSLLHRAFGITVDDLLQK